RQDLTPLARGWAEFIIYSIIPTGNKSEITVARAVLIHSIIKGHDVRVEELIADNIAIIAKAAQGRSKLSFPRTIFRLCKQAGVSMAEFRGTEFIPVAKLIIAKIRKEQGDLAKEIEEIKKFQVNQTLMGFRSGPLDKMEERIHETRNKIIEMHGQIKEWTKNASAREAYCCWAHQQANPNLVPIPACEIAKFVHDNAVKKTNIFHGALKNFEQGGPSQPSQPSNSYGRSRKRIMRFSYSFY
ncbi:hypothetical protein PIB30_091114, partial [Stylosanthes scabra]|nr:hypothetical protein [Stylosanthes scabra]